MQTIKACESGVTAFMELMTGAGDKEKLLPLMVPMYQEMAQDIKKQWKRLGGKWAVCQAVMTRAQRDLIRNEMEIGAELGK